MEYVLRPSLEHRALLKIATVLWNNREAREFFFGFHFLSFLFMSSIEQEKWNKEVDHKILKIVLQLPLPQILVKKVSNYFCTVGWHMLTCRDHYAEIFGKEYLIRNLDKVVWTPQGTVDRKKTAQLFVKDESLDVCQRYKLACTYCLTEEISLLWEELHSSNTKLEYTSREHLVRYWSESMEEGLSDFGFGNSLLEFNGSMDLDDEFYSDVCSNLAATKFFFKKFSPADKERFLIKYGTYFEFFLEVSVDFAPTFRDETFDVLLFHFSKMDKEDQAELFTTHPYEVLRCLLEWPWQGFFIETARHVDSFVFPDQLYRLLVDIVRKVDEGFRDYDYQKLFRLFWQQRSLPDKKHVIGLCSQKELLLRLLLQDDKENVGLILKDATPEEKKRIYHNRGLVTCEALAKKGKWDCLKFFISECLLSRESVSVVKRGERNDDGDDYPSKRLRKEEW